MAEGFSTRAVHAAVPPAVSQRPSSVPIYQTSTWGFETSEEFGAVINFERPGHVYGRGYGNPTVEAFEAVMASLEGTGGAFGYASGMAALHAIATTLAPGGDRVVASREIYGGTYALFERTLPRYGVEVAWVDPHDHASVAETLPGAAAFFVETIANPLCTVADLTTLAGLCREAGVASVVDSTFASPYLCTPATLGFDFVMHSATKYIGGHSDLIGGVVCCSVDDRSRLRATTLESGGAMQPFEAWLCVRGLQTLALRMERHCANASALAEVLAGHPRVTAVHYPGLRSHPQHDLARRQFRPGLFGGMLSFEVDGGVDEVAKVCESLHVGWLGASLGGAHTLVTHPASTTHRQLDPDARRAAGAADGLVRVSLGLEDADDVIADFRQALAG